MSQLLLFLCPHSAAKSVLAASNLIHTYVEQLVHRLA